MQTKTCSRCKNILNIDNFYKCKTSKDGFYAYCKECSRVIKKKYCEINKEQIHQYNVQYGKKYYKEHRAENREKEIERLRIYKMNNKEKEFKYHQEYRNKNKEKVNLWTHNHRARKKKLLDTLTSEQWESIKKYFNYSCCYCGSKTNLEKEHYIPASKGGNYSIDNILCACRSCNAQKNASFLEEWYRKQPFFSEERLTKIYKWIGVKNNIQQFKII